LRFGVRRVDYSESMQTQMFGDDKTKLEVGATGEDRAVDHLVRQGMRIVERNYRCKLGELDVIARDAGTLVFVEVRSRRSAEFGSALDAVNWTKRRKVTRLAMSYIAHRKPRFTTARFDVVAITGDELVHIKDAWRL
jgi:putative endonuclease